MLQYNLQCPRSYSDVHKKCINLIIVIIGTSFTCSTQIIGYFFVLSFLTENYHQIYSPDSEPTFSPEHYHAAPLGGHTHQRQDPAHSDYSRNYRHQLSGEGEGGGVRERYRELEVPQVTEPKDFLQDSGGYIPDSTESGSTDADNYDNMMQVRRIKFAMTCMRTSLLSMIACSKFAMMRVHIVQLSLLREWCTRLSLLLMIHACSTCFKVCCVMQVHSLENVTFKVCHGDIKFAITHYIRCCESEGLRSTAHSLRRKPVA